MTDAHDRRRPGDAHVAGIRSGVRSTFAHRGIWRRYAPLCCCFDVAADSRRVDEMINVGWGSKRTQFHGSLGKTAAAQPGGASLLPLAPPEDGERPSITWRGDGAYFAVSSLDAYSATSSRPGGKRRQVRVYQRTPCALSATSEPVQGLQGAPEGATGGLLAWRPAGNLMAAVKKYGYDGGAEGEGGPEARRDIVFFERNGLVHGGFRLREDERVRKGEGDSSWEVVGLTYCSSSEVLAVHISRRDTDVGESHAGEQGINMLIRPQCNYGQ